MTNRILRNICLHLETEVAYNCIIKGLGDVKRISFNNDFYYAPLSLLSSGFEKLLKCILCYIYRNEDGIVDPPPFEYLGLQGHNIGEVLNKVLEELEKINYQDISEITKNDINIIKNDEDIRFIIELLTNFGMKGRYYNLNIVLNKKVEGDPVNIWKDYEVQVL
ncbi:MAG: hypothetical protein ACFFG0_24770 [Candidatus Thorarchaeota archaeon]